MPSTQHARSASGNRSFTFFDANSPKMRDMGASYLSSASSLSLAASRSSSFIGAADADDSARTFSDAASLADRGADSRRSRASGSGLLPGASGSWTASWAAVSLW